MRWKWGLGIALVACTRSGPPHGEVIVWIDTDAPVPQIVSRLRIEVLRASDGSMISKLDTARPDPNDWPASFGLVDTTDVATNETLVRIRAYPEGRLDEHGEPQAPVTIDRIVRIAVKPNVVENVHVTLRGECFGTPASVATATSCTSTSRKREAVAQEATSPEGARASVAGSFAVTACTAPVREHVDGLFQDELCVPGAPFLFGNREVLGVGAESGLPERVVAISPMRVDRYEVTVGRWRNAVTNGGFVPPSSPGFNNGPLVATAVNKTGCTYSDAPMDRENLPLNCVTIPDARAFCQWSGGDLPSEAQWEYVAQAALRPRKTSFPWGNDLPDCDRAVFERTLDLGALGKTCMVNGKGGPAPVDFPGDTTAPDDSAGTLGIFGLGGNVNEFVLDAHMPLSDPCWTKAPLRDPVCSDDTRPFTLRGGFWGATRFDTRSSLRGYEGPPPDLVETVFVAFAGFRCVRPGSP